MTQSPFMIIAETPIYRMGDGSYIALVGFDIDGDGAGGNAESDPDFQGQTSYRPSLNSRMDKFWVIPGILNRAIPESVMGCLAKATNVIAGIVMPCTVGDVGPDDKIGEGSICLAEALGIPSDPRTGGTQQPKVVIQFWPGVQAPGYRLQSL